MTLIIYFNEISCEMLNLSLEAVRSHVTESISALQEIGRLRRDTALKLPKPLATITMTESQFTFAQLFSGRNDKFSILKRYIDRAPFRCCDAYSIGKDVVYKETIAIGMSMAHSEKSFTLSIGHSIPWSEVVIKADEHYLDENGDFQSVAIDISNLASPDHVLYWRNAIEEYGMTIASSSLIYQGAFEAKMFFDDHDPPHIHIYPFDAKIRIDNGDLLEGNLPSGICKDVSLLVSAKREVLMAGWLRCRRGCHPFRIFDY